ncbi:D-alanyl-D-alanine carboxypeptidase/D-alanyl-D-alanine-endopeptidase (penicillin-binding protein 4) [Nocardioides luteus]|uniref:D-alanyl-D-alanine carboxypeptidase n=1 Tax=Nocardioides luteus TaxID=1844 RepID=A0ABQ5SZF0_9ACTN|nr:D-alanyl-D-alanine carboxypeptidase/D-alanyl-D-alanine-endopeptidase [Nocardioides luteus]MDR7312717.1 D-alanyl-D-alanine carboxypeptidase/D-alanyl-D-alanine-endopeptidase (penicillin-binding protein 4) [Nocardioides luteus]GGR47084.1 D-alanyl-D-alanine carboxypeptidase [Nocardioides luteus]GLJ68970.1 D-alanyl-D-alanine carboxypeptidase [Nocardioides luteus]
MEPQSAPNWPSEEPDEGRGKLVVILPLVLALLVGAAAAAYGLGWVRYARGNVAPTPPPVPLSIAAVSPAAVEGQQTRAPGKPDQVALEGVMRGMVRDKRLGKHLKAAIAPLEGAPLVKHGSGAATPASVTKVLTSVAVLEAYGPERRFETSVTLEGRTITLVGGGDASLSSSDLDALAAETARELGATKTVRLAYDDSLFTGPTINPAWRRTYLGGEVGGITALSVDHGGSQAYGYSRDPSKQAAEQFKKALAKRGIKVNGKPARGAKSGAQLAARQGDTLREIVEYTLQHSDNQLAEILARHVGLASGAPTFEGSAAAVADTLKDLGIDTTGLVLRDGSGLSRQNRIPPTLLVSTLQTAASSSRPELAPALTGLPVAGWVGSLSRRFNFDAEPGRGRVRAKTGTLTSVSGLSGIVVDTRGTPFVVVLMADGFKPEKTLDVRDALDDAMTAVATCRCSA